MKILLQTGDELLFLAGDGRVSPRIFAPADGFDLSGELVKQVVRKVRGSHAKPLHRGNIRHRAFFRTRRLFPTAAEAEEFLANAERSFPRTGTVIFITGGGTRKLLNARVSPPRGTLNGAQALLQYQVHGGEFTPLEPELVIDGIEQIHHRQVSDEEGIWFEVGFDSPVLLDGNASDGWTDPGGNLLLRFQRSEDLAAWDYLWDDAPSSPETITEGYRYWARSPIPRLWKYVTIDVTATTSRYGKSITAISLFGSSVSLPNYPYAMPAAAATLKTDLIAAGYAGADVYTTSAALTAVVTRYYYASSSANIENLPVTMSGSNVTMVKTTDGANITLPGYPYAMPAQQATLQAALVTAGYTGAVVRLYADPWTIFLPNRTTILNNREENVTISPGDPFLRYDRFGGSQTNQDNIIESTYSNLRATTGLKPLSEALKQFARLGVSPGPNYLY